MRRNRWLAVVPLLICVALASAAGAEEPPAATPREHAADVLYERGTHALRRGDVTKAVELLEEAHSRYPDDAGIQSAYARALLAQGEAERAADLLDALVSSGRASPDDYLVLGLARYSAQDYERARAALQTAVERDPDNATAHLFLGSALVELEMNDAAERELAEAERLDPSLASQVAYRRGRIALSEGDRQQAEKYFAEVERLAPGSAMARAGKRELTGGAARPRPWSVYGTVGGAYDSNVNLSGDDENLAISRESDQLGFIEVGGDYTVLDLDRLKVRFGASLYTSYHEHQQAFNLLTARVWTSAAVPITDQLTVDARYTYEYILANYRKFRRAMAVEPSIRYRPRPDLLSRIFFRYEDRNYLFDYSLSTFDRDGQVYMPGAEQYWFMPDFTGYGQGFLRLRYFHRTENTTGRPVDVNPFYGDFTANRPWFQGPEFDSKGNALEFLVGMPLPWQLFAMASFGYEWRHYGSHSLFENTSDRRKDRIRRYQFILRRPISEHFTAEVGYDFTDWGSNVDFYAYERHIAHFLVTYQY